METGFTIKNLQHYSWALMIQEQSRSRLSILDWCSQNNISTNTFYYRRDKLGPNCFRRHLRSLQSWSRL